MKKNYYTIKTLIVLLSLVAFNMNAQLSGIVTINSAATTGGTNYQTFNAFATALNTNGVSGPLTVNVVSNTGPYVEQVMFTQCPGMSSANRITINGNGNVLAFTATASTQPYTMLLNGADYMTIKNLNLIGQGTTYALVCLLTNAANYNMFSSCTFSAPVNGTSTGHCPFAISSSSTSATSGGTDAGNYNTVSTCTMSNGYYGCVFYGLTSSPYQSNNSLLNSLVTDFYYYGVYYPYQNYITVKGNTLDRATRTTTSFLYAMYGFYQQGAMIDGNKIHKLFENNQGSTATCYVMYIYYTNTSGGARNTIRNNIITNIKSNGTIYGMYAYYMHGDIYNNTVDLDYSACTSGTNYGIYGYGGVGYDNTITNNIVSINRGASTGTKYGISFGGVTGNVVSDRNVIYMAGNTAGTNYYGYYSATATAFNTYTAQGVDATSYSVSPTFTGQITGDLHPTNSLINNAAMPNGLVFDQQGAIRNQASPDLGALEFLTPSCAGSPTANSVSSPTYALCPGEIATLGLSYLDPNLGITYQWQSSTISQVGPFVSLPGANSVLYTIPTTTTSTWYNVVITCTNPGGGNINATGQIMIAGSTTSTVPYYENFEGIGANDRLPNCSWSSNSLGALARTYTSAASGNRQPLSGTSFAGFSNSSPGTNYFYTNGIQMNVGITYSAAINWATEYLGNLNWTNLSILVGPNQSTTGLVPIASFGPLSSGSYKLLSNTFTVATSGLYYIAIKATSTSGGAQYLSLDDLSITIPCDANSPNSPTLTLSAGSINACSGQPLNLMASGADTYTWNTGVTGSGITDIPTTPGAMNYEVMGTNLLTGCTSTVSQVVNVVPTPITLIYASQATVCSGQQVVLTAFGADSYAWSIGGNSTMITVTPSVGTTYNVVGTNTNGCSSSASQQITVNQLPSVNASSSNPADACKDDLLTLSAGGAVTYQWVASNGAILQGNTINTTLSSNTAFTVTGTDSHGCSNKASFTQNINLCTSISKYTSGLGDLKIYPNPTNGEFTIHLNNSNSKTIEVTDLTGRIILSSTSIDDKINVNINALSNGIYYVKIKSNNTFEVVKVVKQ